MTPQYKKLFILMIIGVTLLTTVIMIIGAYVSYAQPISSTTMQNIYIDRITKFGGFILFLQGVCFYIILRQKDLK